MNSRPNRVLVAYVPSPHRGYLEFFRAYKGSDLYILGDEFIQEYPALARNLPGDDPTDVEAMLHPLGIFNDIHILTKDNLEEVRHYDEIILPDEEVSRAIANEYFSEQNTKLDGSWRLRWHWDASVKKQVMEENPVISRSELDQQLMKEAHAVGERSPDWWRQIGALLVRDGKVLIRASNTHLPSEQSAYHYGDPRSNFDAGQHIDVSTALHAEMGVLSEAARNGISTEGCDLYVTTFPCPPCAYACANSGIRRLFYAEGYSLVAGGEALRSKDVELIRVDLTQN